ncbi:hypothetical protein CAEBREN_02633 [Caenorhabditis brenneri]|uniref:Uncharacterized protein n=1 Tax=Caenorhabditis brenneri TaxID=135651 RepID=G0M987_CAEBE|nr:hypothetical protein CAEBREN_02633 [Caenorhabditis brenneri]
MTRLPFILLLSVFFLFHVDSLKIHIEGKIDCHKKDFTYQFTIQEFDWILAVILTHNVNLTNASGYLKKSDWSDWRQ